MTSSRTATSIYMYSRTDRVKAKEAKEANSGSNETIELLTPA
jgi:hypothetical protein